MKAKLVAWWRRHECPLSERQTTIGRSEGCELTLDYSYVSREHARIDSSGDGYAVHELKSTNGT
jgi:pSer/pThr/pTyr-binding forkhead associated (FHA) protein